MAIHLAQILCPQRHCIIALVYPSEDFTDEQGAKMIEAQLKDWLDKKILNPWCGLCASREFHTETGVTKFQTMKEAMPHVQEEELKQMLTQLAWKANVARN